MNSFTLSFLDPSLEKQYQAEIFQERVKKLSRFMLLENTVVLIFQIYLISLGANWWYFLMFATAIILILIIVILFKTSSKFLLKFLLLNYIGHTIMYVELINLYHSNKITNGIRDDNCIVLVIPLQIIQCMLIFVKSRWIHCSLIYMCCLLYFFFRIVETGPEQAYRFSTVILNFVASWIFFSFIAYDQEKNYKKVYKNIMESYEKVNYFKLILKNVIPSPIFIVDYQNSRVVFSNNSGLNIMRPEESENLAFSYFLNFVRTFSLIKENSMILDNNGNSDLLAILENYYNDPKNQPIKTNSITDKGLGTNFKILNVWNNETTLQNIDSMVLNFSPNNKAEVKAEVRYYEVKIIKIFWENSVCLFVLFHDNTHIFQISELLNQDLYKNQLLASVSHDLRTPLNGLIGMLELSLIKTTDVVVKNYLDLAKKSSFFLNYLVNDILDFSLMNFKKMRLGIEEVNLKEICEEMLNLIEFQAKEKKIDLKFTCNYAIQYPILSDPTRIKQILLNLLSNALKFTYNGFIELILQDFPENREIPLYKISVKDTGIGIKKEDFCKLYKLFGKLENQEQINRTGIGLGLTISKKISKLLCPVKNEGLEVESEYGKGSQFYFFISSLSEKAEKKKDYVNTLVLSEESIGKEPVCSSPYYFDEENLSLFTLNTLRRDSKSLVLKKALVVDDDIMNLLIAEQYLHLFKIPSLKAINGLEAYKIIKTDYTSQKNEISIVLMDCNMPILDGFQASKKINDFLAKNKRKKVPILAVTANTTAADIQLCKNSGMEYFLEKPLKKNDLKHLLENIFNVKIAEDTSPERFLKHI